MKKLMIATVAGLALSHAAIAADMAPAGKDAKGPRHHGRMFEKMDTNSDGAVTKEEARTFHEKRFDEMDANKDGKVTKEETKAYFDKKREEHKKD